MKCLSVLLLIVMTAGVFAAEFQDVIYDRNVKSVVMTRDGVRFSNPVMVLNSNVSLLLTFDILEADARNLYYKIVHCDYEWNESFLVYDEYMTGFEENPIADYAFSINTTTKYVNYLLELPNDDVSITKSGNYALIVYDKDNNNELLMVKRFYVVTPRVGIDCKIKNALNYSSDGRNQEIDFSLDVSRVRLRNPNREIKVVVKQNTRDDNAISNLKPMFISDTKLEYNYDSGNIFKGLNEFRIFDSRPLKYPGEQVLSIDFHTPFYHITLKPQLERKRENYSFYNDMNGQYFIESKQTDSPDIGADYQFVHFSLYAETPFLGGGIYVFGSLNNWVCNETNRMTWNSERKLYEASILLKQGYYNYMFAYQDASDNEIDCSLVEGSFPDTENTYQIFVYYKGMADRYEQLIGYQKFNSNLDRGF